MPENEFEKQVQQKMEEFKVRPAAEVWNAVAETIAKQKRRRRLVLFSVVLLCFLAGGTLFLSTNTTKHFFTNDKQAAVNTSTIKNNNSTNTNTNTNHTNNLNATNNTAVKNDVSAGNSSIATTTDSVKAMYQRGKNTIAHNDTDDNSGVAASSSLQQKASIKKASAESFQPTNKKKRNHTAGKKSIITSGGTVEEVENETAIKNENEPHLSSSEKNKIVAGKEEVAEANTADTAGLKSLAQKLADSMIDNAKHIIAATKKDKQKGANKWAFGINLAIGKSSTATYDLGFGGNAASDYFYAAPSTGSGGNGTVNNGRIYTPSKINSGTAFSLGFAASYKLSKKSHLLTGLNYKLLTTSHSVGNDSSANNIISFAAGYKSTYHNQYHFIEIPIIFQTGIFTIKKHAVNLETGLSLSQLISTNSLQFNTTTSKYYVDNTLFNKTIIGLSLGLSFNLSAAGKAAFLIGPQINYGFTTVAGTGLYEKTHYGFAGIHLQKMFKKN